MEGCFIPDCELKVSARSRRLMDCDEIPDMEALMACVSPSSILQCSVHWGERLPVQSETTSISFPDVFASHTELWWKIFGYQRNGRTDGAIFEERSKDEQQTFVSCSDTPQDSVASLSKIRALFVKKLQMILRESGTLDTRPKEEHSTYRLLACAERNQTERHTIDLTSVDSVDAFSTEEAAYVSLRGMDCYVNFYVSSAILFSMENIKLLKKLGQALDAQRIRYLYFM